MGRLNITESLRACMDITPRCCNKTMRYMAVILAILAARAYHDRPWLRTKQITEGAKDPEYARVLLYKLKKMKAVKSQRIYGGEAIWAITIKDKEELKLVYALAKRLLEKCKELMKQQTQQTQQQQI